MAGDGWDITAEEQDAAIWEAVNAFRSTRDVFLKGTTYIMAAAYLLPDPRIMRAMLGGPDKRYEQKINAQDENGWTAAMWAAIEGHGDVLDELMKYDQLDLTLKDLNGEDVLDIWLDRAEDNELSPETTASVAQRIRDAMEARAKPKRAEARDLVALQTLARGSKEPSNSATDRAIASGILPSQVGKFLTPIPIGESVAPAIATLKRKTVGARRRTKKSKKSKTRRQRSSVR